MFYPLYLPAGTIFGALLGFLVFAETGVRAETTTGALPEVSFTVEGPVHESDPFLTVEWEPENEAGEEETLFFELQQAQDEDFAETATRYRGPDRASFVSGLPEGEFFFRVRTIDREQLENPGEGNAGAWSETLEVRIEYVSLTQAFVLFGIGAVVAIATVLLVVAGDRRVRNEEARKNAA